jgi:hypothetical protein
MSNPAYCNAVAELKTYGTSGRTAVYDTTPLLANWQTEHGSALLDRLVVSTDGSSRLVRCGVIFALTAPVGNCSPAVWVDRCSGDCTPRSYAIAGRRACADTFSSPRCPPGAGTSTRRPPGSAIEADALPGSGTGLTPVVDPGRVRVFPPTMWAGRLDNTMATRKRHRPEQVVRRLAQADRMLGEGKDVAAVRSSGGMRPWIVVLDRRTDPHLNGRSLHVHPQAGYHHHSRIAVAGTGPDRGGYRAAMAPQPPADVGHRHWRWWFTGIAAFVVALVVTIVVIVVPPSGDERATANGTATAIANALTDHDQSAYGALVCPAKHDRIGDVGQMPDVDGSVSVGRSNFLRPTRDDPKSEDLFQLPAPTFDANVVILISQQVDGQWCLNAISECLNGIPDSQEGLLCESQTLLRPQDSSGSGSPTS